MPTADAVFTTDTGMSTVWLSRFVQMTGERALLGSFNLGSMANAMPQALGGLRVEPESGPPSDVVTARRSSVSSVDELAPDMLHKGVYAVVTGAVRGHGRSGPRVAGS